MTLPGALGGRVCGMREEHESLGARGQTAVVSPQDGLQEHLPPGVHTFVVSTHTVPELVCVT